MIPSFILAGVSGGPGVAIHDIIKTKHHQRDERSLNAASNIEQSVLFHIYDAHLRDLKYMQGLRMDMLSADTALFSGHCRGQDWEAEGNVTIPLEQRTEDLISGGLRIPGLAFAPEIPVNGTWIVVDQTSADQKAADAFENTIAQVHKQHQREHEEPMSLEEMVMKFY